MAKKPESAAQQQPEASKRDEALKRAIEQIEKEYGKGAVMRLGADVAADVGVIPTGSLALDLALGVGGVPRGRVVEVYGPEASGKTTLSLHMIANAQRAGGVAAFVDAEHAFDPDYARQLGLNLDELLVSQPDTGEQALEIVELLVRSNAVDIVVVDSVAALVPRAEIEGEMGDSFVGLQARLMSQALRKLTGAISKSRACVVFINQIRTQIGAVYGVPEITPGGRALKFYASVRIDIRRIGSIKRGEEVIGNRTRVKTAKNKVAAPFKFAEFDILFGEGISREGDLIDLGTEAKVLQKSGTWISYGEKRLGQGREAARQFLKEDAALADEIEARILEARGIQRASGVAKEPSPAATRQAPRPAPVKAAPVAAEEQTADEEETPPAPREEP
jgi:recombination protein RecA